MVGHSNSTQRFADPRLWSKVISVPFLTFTLLFACGTTYLTAMSSRRWASCQTDQAGLRACVVCALVVDAAVAKIISK